MCQRRVDFENGTDFSIWTNSSDFTLAIGNQYDSGFCEVCLNDIDNLIEFLKDFRDSLNNLDS